MAPCIAVIPVRYQSSRFPGKPLALVAGQPMLEHVWRRCQRSGAFTRVVVATDDQRIANAARRFGAEVMMTSAACASGTQCRATSRRCAHKRSPSWQEHSMTRAFRWPR